MSFWKKCKQLISWKHVISAIAFFALAIGLSFIDSADDVSVSFEQDAVIVSSKSYKMTVGYHEIENAELTAIANSGEKISGSDNMTLRTGTWKNETWGEYNICADLDCTKCIVLHLTDGSTYVFSRLSNKETESLYQELLTHITN